MNNEYKEPQFRGLLIALNAFTCVHNFEDMSDLVWLINRNYPSEDMLKKDAIIQQAKRISDRYLAYMKFQE